MCDLDLDEMQEVSGDPITVRLEGSVIHIMHAGDWTASAMRAAANGDWDAWAREVIESNDEYQVWEDANLRNSKIEAVFAEVGRRSRMSMGKSKRPSGSRRSTRKK